MSRPAHRPRPSDAAADVLEAGYVKPAAVAIASYSAVAFLAGAPAASASGSGTECPSGRVCFYFNSDFLGARADYAHSDAGMGNKLFTDGPAGRSG